MVPSPSGHGITTVVLDWKTSGVGLPPSNVRIPVIPLRSGRLPKVIERDATPFGGHTAATGTENSPGVGGFVVVVPPPPVVVVVDFTVVVVAAAVVVVAFTVVVDSCGGFVVVDSWGGLVVVDSCGGLVVVDSCGRVVGGVSGGGKSGHPVGGTGQMSPCARCS
jgi:hypothetical protein